VGDVTVSSTPPCARAIPGAVTLSVKAAAKAAQTSFL
jgi:hypothetical protein